MKGEEKQGNEIGSQKRGEKKVEGEKAVLDFEGRLERKIN